VYLQLLADRHRSVLPHRCFVATAGNPAGRRTIRRWRTSFLLEDAFAARCGIGCVASLFMSGAAIALTAARNRGAPTLCTRSGPWKRSRATERSRAMTDGGFALGAGRVFSILPALA